MAFFLSTRLVTAAGGGDDGVNDSSGGGGGESGKSAAALGMIGEDVMRASSSGLYEGEEPAKRLRRFETHVAEIASEFEDGMVRF